MIALLSRNRLRRSLPSLVFLLVLATLALVFRGPLVAWFSGKSLGGSAGTAVTAQPGGFQLKASLDPDPPAREGNALLLEVRDAAGKPVDDARVDVLYDMPAMGAMAEMKGNATVTRDGAGHYRAAFDLPMGGTFALKARVSSGAESATQDFTITVGNKGLTVLGGSASAAENATAEDSNAIDHYTCSMHPSVHQQGPGKCPICGMDLTPVTKVQQEQGVVMIDEARRQLIGVRVGSVTEAPMQRTLQAVGRVTYDESKLTDVTLKVQGWITKLLVSETGQRVKAGQTLFQLYSPDLFNAQQDFLLATRGGGAGAPVGSEATNTKLLAQSSRQRLHLLGMGESAIDALAQRGVPSESIPFPSPASGFVIEKNVVEGAAVEAGMKLYRIAALDSVWVEAEVYEADLPHVRVGQHASVTLDYVPGRSYGGKVSFIYPFLDPTARTGRVRVELANPELELRPGMYASVQLASKPETRVQVPVSAVVYTGPRRLVFVDLGEGRFRPQEVRVGAEGNGMYELLEGLTPGDRVATSGVFLIAAEARISTAAKYWEKSQKEPVGVLEPEQPSEPPAVAMPHASPQPMPSAKAQRPAPPLDSESLYTCPMHPEVQSGTPGKCPKCGMDLVQKPKGGTK
ncbi:MAG: efflux RND transporter periplasmic adaptor subunit [Deltaproteobacteria bacterium]